ncbi:hypothetical protein ACFQYP_45410 [Nonomuraea antimicrobica]
MDLVWPATVWALWIATLAAAVKVCGRDKNRRRAPGEQPPGGPPGPVAELLRGMRAQEVFHSALFDLARRGWVTIEGDRLSDGPPLASRPAPTSAGCCDGCAPAWRAPPRPR